jgi:AraC family transcriptional regulator
MTRQDSRAEYAERMHRVLAHIDQHIDQPLDLPRLAQVAHFSAFHFHRLFAAWMGETLGDYLRRRRLEVAAMRMIAQPRLPVLTVALSVGWGSGEAFARAFKMRFGCPPSQWRALSKSGHMSDSKIDQALRNTDQAQQLARTDDAISTQRSMEIPMQVQLIDRQPVRVAYRRHVGPYGPPIHAFWMNEVAPWMQANNLFERPRYGISHDDPSITEPSQCRYDAAVEVDAAFTPGAGAFVTTLPGGRYASMPFFGTSEDIATAWQRLLRDWLASSGLQLDARPCFEFYAPAAPYDAASGRFGCDIVIPVAPL